MKFGTFLLSLVQPMIAKILIALGFSIVSIVGVEASLNQVKALFVSSFMAMPADLVQLALYLWIGKAAGVIFGACATKLMLWSIQNATSLLGKNPS